MTKTAPDPIDAHVGRRIRIRRVLLGMSQEKLGEAVALTFQQIQKYEKGANRVSASRLSQFARFLDVEVSYFFEGAPKPVVAMDGAADAATRDDPTAEIASLLGTAEGAMLARCFVGIADPKIRKRVVDLVAAIAGAPSGDLVEAAPAAALAA